MYSLSHSDGEENEGPCVPGFLVPRFNSAQYSKVDGSELCEMQSQIWRHGGILFVRFAMCVDPRKQAASGVWSKARRTLGIGVTGLSESEKRIRKALDRPTAIVVMV